MEAVDDVIMADSRLSADEHRNIQRGERPQAIT
jgi:hypothetical protein